MTLFKALRQSRGYWLQLPGRNWSDPLAWEQDPTGFQSLLRGFLAPFHKISGHFLTI